MIEIPTAKEARERTDAFDWSQEPGVIATLESLNISINEAIEEHRYTASSLIFGDDEDDEDDENDEDRRKYLKNYLENLGYKVKFEDDDVSDGMGSSFIGEFIIISWR